MLVRRAWIVAVAAGVVVVVAWFGTGLGGGGIGGVCVVGFVGIGLMLRRCEAVRLALIREEEVDVHNLPHDGHGFTAEDTPNRQRGEHIQRFTENLLRLVEFSLIFRIHQADCQHHRRMKGMEAPQTTRVPLIR